MAAELTLVIGDKNYSSWSLRPWLALKMAGLPFQEIRLRLRQPDTKAQILKHSPAGQVPVLKWGDGVIWDSLSICEWVAETAPAAQLWPADPLARAVARSAAAEMHSGFAALRRDMPMDIVSRHPIDGVSADALAQAARVVDIWTQARSAYGTGGPFLFGRFSIADAMYAPVVTRFQTYGYGLSGPARAYADAILALPAMIQWAAEAKAEYAERGPL